jgi:hypothetical protein
VVGTAVEGSPVQFSAGTFGPVSAFSAPGQLKDPVTYAWQFQENQCGIGCLGYIGGPEYTTPKSGNPDGTISWSFPTSGNYSVILSVTDTVTGGTATDTFSVPVADVPPTLAISPDCSATTTTNCVARTVAAGSPTDLSAVVTHTGTADIDNVYVDWGDNTSVDSAYCGIVTFPTRSNCGPGSVVPGTIEISTNANPLVLTEAAGGTQMDVSDSHTYAKPGTYSLIVTVTDQGGATVSDTIVEHVTESDLAISNMPSDVTVDATSPLGAVVKYTGPSVVDEDPTASVSCDWPSGSTFPIGTTMVICKAVSDDTNSPVSASFNVTVRDNDLALSNVRPTRRSTPPALRVPWSPTALPASGTRTARRASRAIYRQVRRSPSAPPP